MLPMKVQSLGHTFLKVRDRERAERFYTDVLGMTVAARLEAPAMTFFTLGNHHDFGIIEVGDGPDAPADSPGLFHVAFKIGDSLEDLRTAKADLEATGATVDFAMDHSVTQSVYLRDPDDNMIELYVDVSDGWRADPNLVTAADLLEL
jgi:catechol 2,3-dioxygenase